MSFQPIVPVSGLAGWGFLNRTLEAQKATFAEAPQFQRDQDYFRANINKIETAADLVGDRRLLSFALSAFGLEDDLPNKYFIQKVLEDGTLESDALANRLSDKSYKAFSETFGLGDGQVRGSILSDFSDKIIARFETAQFEKAVGEVDGDMRIALNLRRELAETASDTISERAKYYTILGSAPMRLAFETAFRLPSAFGALDIDRQVDTLEAKVAKEFPEATVSQFSDPELLESFIQKFLLQSDVQNVEASYSPASTALALLQA